MNLLSSIHSTQTRATPVFLYFGPLRVLKVLCAYNLGVIFGLNMKKKPHKITRNTTWLISVGHSRCNNVTQHACDNYCTIECAHHYKRMVCALQKCAHCLLCTVNNISFTRQHFFSSRLMKRVFSDRTSYRYLFMRKLNAHKHTRKKKIHKTSKRDKLRSHKRIECSMDESVGI